MSPPADPLRVAAGARKVVTQCAGLRAGERALVVTDYLTAEVGRALAEAAGAAGAEVVVVVMPPRGAHGEEPPGAVRAALAEADVAFIPVARSISHTEAVRAARSAGARVVVMPEFELRLLAEGGIEADFAALRPLVTWYADRFGEAGEAHLTCPRGTDARFSLAGRPGRALTASALEPGAFTPLPNLEASIAPLEGTAEGTLVVDGSVAGQGLVRTPIRLALRGGRAVSVEGGEEAARLRRTLEAAGDEKAWWVGELGVGLNPKMRLTGTLLEDEGSWGTVHVALGSNAGFGGTIATSRHLDLVLRSATLALDGEVVVREGVPVGHLRAAIPDPPR